MWGDADRLSRMEEEFVYVEGSLQRACEYIEAFRDSYESGGRGDAQVYFEWLRNAYLALPPLAAHLQDAVARSVAIAGRSPLELNVRLRLSLDGIQVLGEAVREAARLLGEAVYAAS